MASLNKVQIIGNLGADPEMRFTSNGQGVSTFNVAVNRRYQTREGEQREETEWVRCVAWAKLAELVSQYVTKGSQIYVEGRLQTRQWEDKEGQRRYTTEVVAKDVQFLDRRGDGGGGGFDAPTPDQATNSDPDDRSFE
jgi:single-strand DNA-binding protein